MHHWQEGTYLDGVYWLRVQVVDLGTQILQFAVQELGLQPPEDGYLAAKISYCWRLTFLAESKALIKSFGFFVTRF